MSHVCSFTDRYQSLNNVLTLTLYSEMKQCFLKLVYPSYNLLTIYSVLFFNHEQIDQILIHQQIELLESK